VSQQNISSEDDDEIGDERRHLMNRDTPNLTFPDVIYALGGGGRKMVLEIFSQDWVIIEALRGSSSTIDITFIDSATENQENHAKEVEELRQKKNEIVQQLQEEVPSGTSVGSININEQLITNGLNITEKEDLTGSQTVEKITDRVPTLDSWWLQRSNLNKTGAGAGFYDVSKGAVKRRALGKALHYKALAEGNTNEYENALNTNQGQDDNIAVFVGLGGGTGSGTFIDIAQKIERQNQAAGIDIFATLPTSSQRDEARANAFAALTELEYLQLDGEPPFRDVFVFPLEPTGLDAEATDTPNLSEFDQAMVYAVLGIYNSDDRDYALGNDTPYAPFTVAVPQVLAYSKEKIRARKNDIEEVLQAKKALLNIEYTALEEVEAYLDEHYSGVDPVDATDLNSAARSHIETRLARLEQLVRSDLLAILDIELGDDLVTSVIDMIYGELDEEANTVEDAVNRRSLDDIVDGIEFIKQSYNVEGGLVDNYVELDNDFIEDIIGTELTHLHESLDVLQRLRGAELASTEESVDTVDTDADTKLLKTFLIPPRERNRQSREMRWRSLKNDKGSVGSDIEDIEEDIEAKRTEIANESDKYSDTVHDGRQRFLERTDSLGEYVALRDVEYEDELEELETTLDNYAATLSESRTGSTSRADVNRAVESLKKALDEDELSDSVDIDYIESRITASLGGLQQAKTEWEEMEEEADGDDGGILSDIIGGDDGNGTIDNNEYAEEKRAVESESVFSLPRPPNTPNALDRATFTVDVEIDLEEEITETLDEAEETAEKELVNAFDETVRRLNKERGDGGVGGIGGGAAGSGTETRFNFREELKQNDSGEAAIKSVVEQGIRATLDTNTDQLEREKETLENKKATLEVKKQRLDAVWELYEELMEDIKKTNENGFEGTYKTYDETFKPELFEQVPGRDGSSNDISGLYEHAVEPSNLTSVVKSPSLSESGLLESNEYGGNSSQERDNIFRLISQIGDRKVTDGRYHGLEHESFYEPGVGSFSETGVYVSFLSEAIDSSGDSSGKLHPGDLDVREAMIGVFNVDDPDNNYADGYVANSHPWEVAMCVYIQGSTFVDNLRNVQMNKGGYHQVYQNMQSGGDILERHALHLEKGHYHVREKLNELETGAALFVEENESEICRELLDRHEKHDIGARTGPNS
jgi:flagellar biosynthesis chaperone FliJ